MKKPIIGLTSSRTNRSAENSLISVPEAYVQALLRAGGLPLILPLTLSRADLANCLEGLDGVLFTGGGDVQPEQYGGAPHALVAGVDPDRDQFEIDLLRGSLAKELPFLGICRGLQLINVALGGTLYEDILDQHPGALVHQQNDLHPRSYRAHSVEIQPQSHLAQVLGRTTNAVNSLHHQGIRRLSDQLSASAFAPDGIIEGVEIFGHRFGLAVQWHPEWLPDDPAMQALFAAFVSASSRHD